MTIEGICCHCLKWSDELCKYPPAPPGTWVFNRYGSQCWFACPMCDLQLAVEVMSDERFERKCRALTPPCVGEGG